ELVHDSAVGAHVGIAGVLGPFPPDPLEACGETERDGGRADGCGGEGGHGATVPAGRGTADAGVEPGARFELAAPAVQRRCSDQLSYPGMVWREGRSVEPGARFELASPALR